MANATLTAGLSAALSRMSERERRLVAVTAAVAVLMVVGGAFWWASSTLDARARRVRSLDESLQQILALETQYREAAEREQQSASRLRSNSVSLFSVLQRSAGELGLVLNDLNERQVPMREGGLTEVSVEVNLKQVSIDKLSLFLEKIEGRSSAGLVKVMKLKVKTRHDNDELLDVNMTVSTWKAS